MQSFGTMARLACVISQPLAGAAEDCSPPAPGVSPKPPYPPSTVLRSVTWHWDTLTTAAPGSDLWPVTWGADDQLYTAWGDGGGFGGTDSQGRVSLGFARIEGAPENFRGFNINGGEKPEHPAS